MTKDEDPLKVLSLFNYVVGGFAGLFSNTSGGAFKTTVGKSECRNPPQRHAKS